MANFAGEIVLSKTDPDKDKLVLTGDPQTMIFVLCLVDKKAVIKPSINSSKDYIKYIKSNTLKKIELDMSSDEVTKGIILSILQYSKIIK